MVGRHPTDRLITNLIDAGRLATHEEIRHIVDRMAAAPFHQEMVTVPVKQRGTIYLGRALGTREDSLLVHLIKRVLVEGQWAFGTTEHRYLADLRQAVQLPDARLVLFVRQGGYLAATVSRTDQAVSVAHRGPASRPFILVVYSADRSALITGYQFSSLERVSIPGEALWLK